jgi:peptidoglycan/xylan/chitin deacetylase (PgdA/CDA1 family)
VNRLTVFGWHNVDGTWCFPSPPGRGQRGLEQQLRFLQRFGNVVPLREALRKMTAGEPMGPRAVAITFDDGYRDNLDIAAPLLERLGIPATFFLVPGLLSREVRPWWEVLAWAFARTQRASIAWEGEQISLNAPTCRPTYERVAEELKRRNRHARDAAVSELVERLQPEGAPGDAELFLDWNGAQQLARRGHDIGSHSLYHAILAEEGPEEQYRDLAESRRLLQQELGIETDMLAYPNGGRRDYDATTVAAARSAGYSHALTTLEGLNRGATPNYEIRRFVVSPERGSRGLAVVAPPAVTAYRMVKRVTRGGRHLVKRLSV